MLEAVLLLTVHRWQALYNKKHVAFLFYHGDGFGPSMASEEAKLGLMSELEALKLGQEVFLPAFAGTLESAGFKTLPSKHITRKAYVKCD